MKINRKTFRVSTWYPSVQGRLELIDLAADLEREIHRNEPAYSLFNPTKFTDTDRPFTLTITVARGHGKRRAKKRKD